METHWNAISVFLSYAHEDESLLRQLETHLSLLKRQGLISTWYDRQIVPGTNWAEVIDERLEQASIILLLVSPGFLASDYCYQVEMKRALERHEADQARVIPIALRPTDWKGAPFAHLQALPTGAKAITTWPNRDRAFVDVISGVRRVIEDLSFSPASSVRATLPSIWNIPYPRNSFFLGRDDELAQVRHRLQAGQKTALSQPQAISGLGGIGKTQIALEYAYWFSQEYQAVLWARAESREALVSSYVAIASLLQLTKREAKEQEVIQAVKTWLQTHRDWLLILDNADELALVPDFLPPALGGHLILTTRAAATGRLAHRLEIETMMPEQGALLLLRRAGLIAPDALLKHASSQEQGLALQISQELGNLPLALDQAGAYLEETHMDLASYWRIYQQRRADLLLRRGGLVADHPAPVATTWSLSFQKVEEKNLAAADLLRLCAFLSPDAIAEEILTAGASSLGPVLAPVATDAFLLNQAVEALQTYSLVRRNPRERTLSVHRLVQAVLRNNMDPGVGKQWKQRVVQLIRAASPNVQDVEQWDACEQWVPHVLVCATWIQEEQLDSEESASLLNRAAYYLDDRARYSEAEPLYLLALAIYERLFGTEHPTIANCCNNLALLYDNQERYNEAESLYLRVLKICEPWLRAEHPTTTPTLMDQAVLHIKQRKYAKAKPLLKRALAIREQELGVMHPDTAQSLNNLGSLYMNQEQYDEAEPLYLLALKICEQWLEAEYPDAALPLIDEAVLALNNLGILALNNLALLYWKQRKYVEAEPLYLRTLKICKQRLGADHLNIARIRNNLGSLYVKQRKYAKAKPLLKRALAIREQELGPEHPDTARTLNNLSSLSMEQRKYAEAKPLLKRALAIYKRKLGPEHPTTKAAQKKYASLLQIMKRDVEGKKQEEDS